MTVLLDCQSSYSLLWGTASPRALLERASALGYRALAITDHAALYAWPLLLRCQEEFPCRVLWGASFPLATGEKAVVLVAAPEGYAALCQFVSAWHQGGRGAASPADLCGCAPACMRGLAVLSESHAVLTHLRTCEAEIYFRVGRSLVRSPAWVEKCGISCVWAPEVCMLHAGEYELHRLLRAIARGESIHAVRDAAPVDAWLQSPPAYCDRQGIFAAAMRRSEVLAERLAFQPQPQAIVPPAPANCPSAEVELRRRTYAGARRRYGSVTHAIRTRLEYELALIGQKRFAEYFLAVHDIVQTFPRTCGRGSGAASLVNYCLGVTNVDALRHNLMFERFLNPGRSDPPDIDIDFAWDERDAVLESVFARYGRQRVARVCNHLTFQPRLAIRETARAFGFTEAEISEAIRRLPELRHEYTPQPIRMRGRERRRPATAVSLPDPWPTVIRLAQQLVGLPRALSLHCGGIVIMPGEVAAHVPVEPSAKGQPMIQWEKDGAEEMGLVKIDLLGNRSLAVIRDAVRDVAARKKIPPAAVIQSNPADDRATQDLLARGATMGVFYVESPAMRLLQQKTGRGDFGHLVIHSSIIRPAANQYIQEYVARLHGKPWQPLHPRLAGVFDETYGVPVYQEDVCKLAMALAGFDVVRADRLRKCLGKSDAAARLEAYRPDFFAGGEARGVPRDVLDAAWSMIFSMTGYSFCKPHSASYAQVSFEAAYLKAHYPADFMAAVLSNGGGYYSTQAYISEAMRLGLRIRRPDVNRSRQTYQEEDGGIRVGLMAIAGLTRAAVAHILEARARAGPFADLRDFQARARLDEEDVRRLCGVGALDTLAPHCNRPQILWLLQFARACAAQAATLFAPPPPRMPSLPPLALRQRLCSEYALLGFLVDAHPLALYEDAVACARARVVPSSDLASHIGLRVAVLGWPVTGKVVSTCRQEPMEFFSFEDLYGIYETVLFPEAYRRYARGLEQPRPCVVHGRVQSEWGALTLAVERVEVLPLDRMRRRGNSQNKLACNPCFGSVL